MINIRLKKKIKNQQINFTQTICNQTSRFFASIWTTVLRIDKSKNFIILKSFKTYTKNLAPTIRGIKNRIKICITIF